MVCAPAKVLATLRQHQQLADEQHARVQALITTDKRLVQKQAERKRLLVLYTKSKLDDERWIYPNAD